MRKLVILIFLNLLLLISGCTKNSLDVTSIPDNPENRTIAAKRYLEAVSIQDMMIDYAKEMAKTLPEDEREDFIKMMVKEMNFEVLEELCLKYMQKHFTVKELHALAGFYGSPEGKSVNKKFGKYMADIMPPLMEEVMRSANAVQDKK